MFVRKYTMGFLADGKKKEEEFASLFPNATFSNTTEDIQDHWDVKIGDYTYDVKDVKRIKRSDVFTNEFYHFVEINNVNGELGWLYGKADFIAFATHEYWIIVNRDILKEFIAKKVTKTRVKNIDEALYCIYRRDKRKDRITLVSTLDLMFIATEIKKRDSNASIKHVPRESIYPEKRIEKIKANIKLKQHDNTVN